MVSSPYLIAVFIALFELIFLLAGIRRRNTTSLLFYIVILISTLGYYALSISTDLAEAILANKITYFGGVFLPLLMLLTICDFCKETLPKPLIVFLVGFCLFTLGCVFSIGFNQLYYKDVWITRYRILGHRTITVLEKTYGPLHGVHTFLLVTMLFIAFLVTYKALTTQNRVSKQMTLIMSGELFFTAVIYLLQRATGAHIEYMPYAYVAVGAVHLSTSMQLQFYDTSVGFSGYRVEHKSKNAYISYNKALRLMDATENALEIYPELIDVRFGTYVYDTTTNYYNEIHQWLGKLTELSDMPHEKTVSRDDKFYRISMVELSAMNGYMQGYMVEIHDDTKNHAMIQLLEKDKIKLHEDATTDAMTGLLNKAASEQQVDELAASSAHATFLMLDLDSFKLVNDLHGHDAGDKVLIEFARLMRGITRATDIVGRIGGDEFIICFRGWQTVDSLERWTKSLNENLLTFARELLGQDMNIPLGVSVGAVFIPDSGTNYEDIRKKADKALYYVKQHGKHGLHVHREKEAVSEESAELGSFTTDEILKSLSERNILPGALSLSDEGLSYVYRSFKRYYDASSTPCSVIVMRPSSGHLTETETDKFLDLLQKSLRQKDLVSKRGSDIFLAILPDTDEVGASTAASGILAKWTAMGGTDIPIKVEIRSL